MRVRDAALEADAWWLAVPDDEIYTVAGRLAEALPAVRRQGAPQPLAIHSSGLGSIHLLKPLFEQGVRVLCLHPLQTFAGEPDAKLLQGVPCAVTAHEERDLQLGEELAGRLGMRPFRLADEQKTLYHLAAVVGCNLLVALESEARRLMDEATGDSRGLDHLSVLLETTMKQPAAERRAGVRADRSGRARRRRHRARAPAPARPREPAARRAPTAP